MPQLICVFKEGCGACMSFKDHQLAPLQNLARDRGIQMIILTSPQDHTKIEQLPSELKQYLNGVPAFFYIDDNGNFKTTAGYQDASSLLDQLAPKYKSKSRSYYVSPSMKYR